MRYYIKVWEGEEEREQGNPYQLGYYTDIAECLKHAERIYAQGAAYIEVLLDNKIYKEYEND